MRRKRRRLAGSWNREEDLDPMTGVANLADVMLVFACGLMVALVLRWNVNLGVTQQLTDDRLQEVTGSEQLDQQALLGDRYQSEGTVYRDTETGKLYIIAP